MGVRKLRDGLSRHLAEVSRLAVTEHVSAPISVLNDIRLEILRAPAGSGPASYAATWAADKSIESPRVET